MLNVFIIWKDDDVPVPENLNNRLLDHTRDVALVNVSSFFECADIINEMTREDDIFQILATPSTPNNIVQGFNMVRL